MRICAAPDCDITFECSVTETRKYCSSSCASQNSGMLGKYQTEEAKKRIGVANSISMKQLWKTLEYRVKQAKARLKIVQNKSEILLERILSGIFSNQWKFVGDWSLTSMDKRKS